MKSEVAVTCSTRILALIVPGRSLPPSPRYDTITGKEENLGSDRPDLIRIEYQGAVYHIPSRGNK